jgi:hypothetical protein
MRLMQLQVGGANIARIGPFHRSISMSEGVSA